MTPAFRQTTRLQFKRYINKPRFAQSAQRRKNKTFTLVRALTALPSPCQDSPEYVRLHVSRADAAVGAVAWQPVSAASAPRTAAAAATSLAVSPASGSLLGCGGLVRGLEVLPQRFPHLDDVWLYSKQASARGGGLIFCMQLDHDHASLRGAGGVET